MLMQQALMLNAIRLHLHVYALLTYCFNKEMHYINTILPQDRVLYDFPATPQDMVPSYRSVYAPQNINLDQWLLYDHFTTAQNMMESYRPFHTSQKINITLLILKKQLPIDIELYMRLLINFNNYICTSLFKNTLIKDICQRIKLILMQHLILVHDFAVYIRHFQIQYICNITFLCQLILHCLQCTFKLIAEWLNYILIMEHVSKSSNSYYQYPKTNLIGGGSKFFSIAELSLYFQTNVAYKDVKFCYKDYIKASEYNDGTNTFYCLVPFIILLSKLTIGQLQLIT